MLIVLFGLAGSGKSYIGKRMAKELGMHFWEGDEVVTDAIKRCIANKQPLTQAMRDEFVQVLIQNIREIKTRHPQLIVAQALYKNSNRLEILRAFPDANLIHIKASERAVFERLKKRDNSIDWAYAQVVRADFEEPTHSHSVFDNTTYSET